MKKRLLGLLCFLLFSIYSFSQVSFNKLNVAGMQSEQACSEVLDFNNDGYFDIVYYDMNQSKVKILLNDKVGGFTVVKEVSATIPASSYINILIGDFDNDLFTDFMISYRDGSESWFVKVYKNLGGSDLELFFDWRTAAKPWEEGGVFWDFDNDGDLDIISRSEVYVYANEEYRELTVGMDSWPDEMIFSDSQFRNPLSYGSINVKNDREVYDANNVLWTYNLDVNLDTTWHCNWSRDEFSHDQSMKSSMFIELGGSDLTDRIWFTIEDGNYSFKYAADWNQTTVVKLLDVAEKDSLTLFRWDVADINGDKVLDIIYCKGARLGDNQVWVAELDINDEDRLYVANHYRVFNTSSMYSSLKLVDIDNDNDVDIVNSMDVYLNQAQLNGNDTNGKASELLSEYKTELGKYQLSWTDTTSDISELKRYEVLTSQDKLELQNLVTIKNEFRASRFPVMTTDALSNKCLKGVQGTGWHYWTVRSINSALRGAEWADLDSFYVAPNVIAGSLKPCINSAYIYTLKNVAEEVNKIKWEVSGENNSITNTENYLELKFNSSDSVVLTAHLYRFNQLLETIQTSIYVRAYPKIELDAPDYACAGSNVILKNIADNGDDSINYSWMFFTNPRIIKEGVGLDSVDIIMPDNSYGFLTYLETAENDKYCAYNGMLDKSGNGKRVVMKTRIAEAINDFSAEVACGSQEVKLELDDVLSKDAIYHWNLDGAELVDNQGDSTLIVNWEVGESKEFSLYVEQYGCISDTTKHEIQRKAYPKLAFDFEEFNCHDQAIPLSFTGTAGVGSTFNWDFEDAEIVSGEGEGPYTLKWDIGGVKELSLSVNDAGCIADSSFTLEVSQTPVTPQICGLSVNLSNEAVVYWQTPESENVDSVFVYKESVQANKYERLAAFGRNGASSFVDTATDCSSQSYRYKLSLLDSCGFETEMSDHHKSLHLMLNKGQNGSWNLIWSAYEGLDVGTYSIYRGTNKDNMMKIADISGNVYSFTDQYPPLGDLYYTISISNTQSCNSILRSASMDEFVIQSNIAETKVFSSISDVVFDQVYKFSTQNKILNIFTEANTAYDLEIVDATGKSIYRQNAIMGNFTQEIAGVHAGLYIVKLDFGSSIKAKKVRFK